MGTACLLSGLLGFQRGTSPATASSESISSGCVIQAQLVRDLPGVSHQAQEGVRGRGCRVPESQQSKVRPRSFGTASLGQGGGTSHQEILQE